MPSRLGMMGWKMESDFHPRRQEDSDGKQSAAP
jgi:hypothetical protein